VEGSRTDGGVGRGVVDGAWPSPKDAAVATVFAGTGKRGEQ